MPSKVGNTVCQALICAALESSQRTAVFDNFFAAALESRQQYLRSVFSCRSKVGNNICWLFGCCPEKLAALCIPATQYTSKFDISSMVSPSLTLSSPLSLCECVCVCVMWSLCTSLGPAAVWPLGPGQRHRPLTFIFMANAKRQRHLLNFLCFRKFTFMFSSLLILLSLPLLLAGWQAVRLLGSQAFSCCSASFTGLYGVIKPPQWLIKMATQPENSAHFSVEFCQFAEGECLFWTRTNLSTFTHEY